MNIRRFLPALVIAAVLGSAAISQAQIICTIPCPVFDILAKTQHVIQAAVDDATNYIREFQNEKFYKMSLRVAQWGVTLAKYIIPPDDMPEVWKIHNWFTDDVLYAKPLLYALSYGDPTGSGYGQVVIPRRSAQAIVSALSPGAAAVLRSQLATIDAADSVIIRGSHTTGAIRWRGRAEALLIDLLQAIVVDEDGEQSLTAVLDKLAASQMVHVQNRQTQGEFEVAILEQLLVEQMWDRNADAAHMNMVIQQLQTGPDGEDHPSSLVAGAADTLRGWHLP